jgi:GTPase SAR1 family protein
MFIKKLIIVCIMFFLCLNYIKTSSNNQEEFNILLMGGVGSGKSCFLNKFFYHELPEIVSNEEVGYNAKTKLVRIYEREIEDPTKKSYSLFKLIDTPGMNNIFHNGNNELFTNISQVLKNNNITSINSILYFYPLDEDTSNDDLLYKSLSNLNYHLEEIKSFFNLKEDLHDYLTIIVNKRLRLSNEKIKILKEIKNILKVKYMHLTTDCNEEMDNKLKNKLLKKIRKIKLSEKAINIDAPRVSLGDIKIYFNNEWMKYIISGFTLVISLSVFLLKSKIRRKTKKVVSNKIKKKEYVETKQENQDVKDEQEIHPNEEWNMQQANPPNEELNLQIANPQKDNLIFNLPLKEEINQPQPLQDQVLPKEEYNYEEYQKPSSCTNDLDANEHILSHGKNAVENDSQAEAEFNTNLEDDSYELIK